MTADLVNNEGRFRGYIADVIGFRLFLLKYWNVLDIALSFRCLQYYE